MSEGLKKIHQGIKKLWIIDILILWRYLRAALPLYCVCKSIHLSFFFIVLDEGMGLYHRGIYINIFLMIYQQHRWNYWYSFEKMAIYGIYITQHMGQQLAIKWRHKIKTSIFHNFIILWWIFFKPSLIFFFKFSAFLQSN